MNAKFKIKKFSILSFNFFTLWSCEVQRKNIYMFQNCYIYVSSLQMYDMNEETDSHCTKCQDISLVQIIMPCTYNYLNSYYLSKCPNFPNIYAFRIPIPIFLYYYLSIANIRIFTYLFQLSPISQIKDFTVAGPFSE